MKKTIGLFGVVIFATAMFFNTSIINGQPNSELATSMAVGCTEAFDKCDAEHPTSWREFNKCMHMEAEC